ncbi:hypothetical protein [Agrobacterium bohemicum]|uniref:Uncharacterized protein n=1 Tax=Agrobacterium bohemicum TaxID=2052828 RepID=A0A135P842_9HYPH|nr:hypothetical protein [Agrobacterium bohemicum]KXG87594.1 hypothetical protein ATO67_18275 [Agrobacterium bohemicum]
MTDERDPSKKTFKLSDVINTFEGEGRVSPMAKAMGLHSTSEGLVNLFARKEEERARMAAMIASTGSIRQIHEDIDAQRRRIGEFTASQKPKVVKSHAPALVTPKIPPNPILETNRKLKDIESKFEDMLDVMGGAAKIATDIQSHAVQFLDKFDKASEQTDHAAKSAIRIAVFAIVISVVTQFIPMGVGYVWPDQTLPSLEKLTHHIVATQEASRAETKRIVEELRLNDQRMAEEIVKVLNRRDEEAARLLEAVRKLAERPQ